VVAGPARGVVAAWLRGAAGLAGAVPCGVAGPLPQAAISTAKATVRRAGSRDGHLDSCRNERARLRQRYSPPQPGT